MLGGENYDDKCANCELALKCDIPFKRLFDQAEESMWILQDERFITSNFAACKQFQINNIESFCGLHPAQISPPLQPDGTLSDIKANTMMENAKENGYCRFEWLHQRLDGSTIPMEITLTAINFAGNPALFAVGRDISHIKDTQKKLHHLANHDPLTGLANRRNFEKAVICEITQSERQNNGFSILFIDLDNFKVINDGLGHSVGDNLLMLVAMRLKRRLSRFKAELYRLGGDEFVVIYNHPQGDEQVEELAKTINQAFENPFEVRSNTLHITSSIGIASFPQHGKSYSELLKNADAAMYKSKALGNNKFVLFNNEIAVRAQERLVLEQELRKAILENHFIIHYQPIFSIDGKLKSAEALIRWKHPLKGMIPPDEFISIAEHTGLIVQMGKWLQKCVCRDLASFLNINSDLQYISINVSIHELQEPEFVKNLSLAVAESQLAPEQIMLEITESGLIQEFDKFNRILKDIKKQGFALSIDDFGTGYSSLSYLKELPVNQLKLDRSFITNLVNNEKDIAIVQAIVTLSDALGLDTLAEGIEDIQTNNLLANMGCDFVQGYLHSKPLTKQSFESLLRNHEISPNSSTTFN